MRTSLWVGLAVAVAVVATVVLLVSRHDDRDMPRRYITYSGGSAVVSTWSAGAAAPSTRAPRDVAPGR